MCIVAATSAMPGGFGGGGGGGHEHVVGSVKVPIHTVHKHHYQRVPEYKIVKVPVIKEVKVPYPVKVPGNFCLNQLNHRRLINCSFHSVKIPYPVVIKQQIHAVPVHKYPVHSSEHVHHQSHGGGGGGHQHGGEIEIQHQEISGKYKKYTQI